MQVNNFSSLFSMHVINVLTSKLEKNSLKSYLTAIYN